METLMHLRKKICLLIALVLFSTLIVQVWASPDPTVTFRGGGVTIELTYPEEAHPYPPIPHDVIIKANTNLALISFSLVVYAPVNSNLTEVENPVLLTNLKFFENDTLSFSAGFELPNNTNGRLYCVISFQTNQTASYSTYMFYTTRVSNITFSEMQADYNKYENLLEDFNNLSLNFNNSVEALNLLTTQHEELQIKYNDQVAAYNLQLSSNDQLSQEYNNLNANYKSKLTELSASQSNYETLNTTKNNLQTSYTNLQNVYNTLNQTYSNLRAQLNTLQEEINSEANELTISRIFVFIALMAVAGLVALIVYLKRKKPEPYVVIRKETVTVENDENPPP